VRLSLIPGPPAASGLTPELGATAEDVVQWSADRAASADDPDGGLAGRGLADRWYRAMGAAVIASLLGCATVASGFDAGEPALRPPAPAGAAPVHVQVQVLQLNLCGSGFAGCYTGRSTAEAAAVIRVERPDVVTLNEVCHGDVSVLQRALADVVPGGVVTSAFHAALDGATGEAVRCRNGQQYGIGMLSRWPTPSGSAAGGGIYPVQDERSSEGLLVTLAFQEPSGKTDVNRMLSRGEDRV
jgi:hypothetical protein